MQAFLIGFASVVIFFGLSLPVEPVYDVEFVQVEVAKQPEQKNDETQQVNTIQGAVEETKKYDNSKRYAFVSYGKHGVAALA